MTQFPWMMGAMSCANVGDGGVRHAATVSAATKTIVLQVRAGMGAARTVHRDSRTLNTDMFDLVVPRSMKAPGHCRVNNRATIPGISRRHRGIHESETGDTAPGFRLVSERWDEPLVSNSSA